MPRNLCRDRTSVGSCISTMASTFCGAGLRPSGVKMCPLKGTSCSLNQTFSYSASDFILDSSPGKHIHFGHGLLPIQQECHHIQQPHNHLVHFLCQKAWASTDIIRMEYWMWWVYWTCQQVPLARSHGWLETNLTVLLHSVWLQFPNCWHGEMFMLYSHIQISGIQVNVNLGFPICFWWGLTHH